MGQLFYYMVYQEKNKRWLTILNQLEENLTVTGKELAIELGCTLRTIQSDIKQIKIYFDSSILLLGGEDGYHFSFQSPRVYIEKKRAIVDQEPLFFFADQLLGGTRKTNQEWAETFKISLASFGRIKRQFVHLLEEQYNLTIVQKDNRLHGEEPAIRQFMYDLYFTLPLCPQIFEQRMKTWIVFKQFRTSESWELDPIRLNQWGQLAQWRINQGRWILPQKGQETIQKRMVSAVDETITCSFPSQEKVVLFLLSLKEDQFLNPLRQKDFIRQFSAKSGHYLSMPDFDDVIVHFFETLISLMNQFFQLSPNKTKEDATEKQTEEELFFKQLMTNYYENKRRVERSLVLSFQLDGSLALQHWIKKKVRKHLQLKGYWLLEGLPLTPFSRQVTVTNRECPQDAPQTGGLPVHQCLKKESSNRR
ncbi:helix-turn-helix domain-containing protein [Enterococcus sp. DIV0840c]|uniref:helix-turn-helix domain-containing protein n=1 Tax=Enterococcus sp. DIV0840c TaxID=2774772 RepID=UPI003D2AE2D2